MIKSSIDYKDEFASVKFKEDILKQIKSIKKNFKEIIIIGVGTDRSTGDCLGPLIGTLLSEHKNIESLCKIYGTLNDPVHAKTMDDVFSSIDTKNNLIIAIDASLSKPENIGIIRISDEPLKPGAGVGKELTPIGDISIAGCVEAAGFMEYMVMQNIRLSFVLKLAKVIEKGLYEALKEYGELKEDMYKELEAM